MLTHTYVKLWKNGCKFFLNWSLQHTLMSSFARHVLGANTTQISISICIDKTCIYFQNPSPLPWLLVMVKIMVSISNYVLKLELCMGNIFNVFFLLIFGLQWFWLILISNYEKIEVKAWLYFVESSSDIENCIWTYWLTCGQITNRSPSISLKELLNLF